jgi:biopolymer transport protein ExbD
VTRDRSGRGTRVVAVRSGKPISERDETLSIRFRCEHCRQTLSAPPRAAGRRITCPACHETTIVPTADRAEPDPGEVLAEEPADVATSDPLASHPEPESTATRVKFSRSRNGDDEMDLTPMVDVVFLLLIFFMITASFSRQKSLEVPPPDPEKKGAQQSQDFLEELEDVSIRVLVDEENRITVDDRPVADPTTLSDVFANLRIREDKSELLLSAHDESLHEIVVVILDAAQDAGLERIRMTSGGDEE